MDVINVFILTVILYVFLKYFFKLFWFWAACNCSKILRFDYLIKQQKNNQIQITFKPPFENEK